MIEEKYEEVESHFAKFYDADPKLQNAHVDMNDLTLLEQYKILVAWKKENNGQYLTWDEVTEIIDLKPSPGLKSSPSEM